MLRVVPVCPVKDGWYVLIPFTVDVVDCGVGTRNRARLVVFDNCYWISSSIISLFHPTRKDVEKTIATFKMR